MALVQLQNPDFVIQRWYTALSSILIITMVTAFNIWCAKKLALAEMAFVSLHIASFFIVLITIAVTSPKNDAKEVFLAFSDNGGDYPLSTFCHRDPNEACFVAMNLVGSSLQGEPSVLTQSLQWALRSWSAKYRQCGMFWLLMP